MHWEGSSPITERLTRELNRHISRYFDRPCEIPLYDVNVGHFRISPELNCLALHSLEPSNLISEYGLNLASQNRSKCPHIMHTAVAANLQALHLIMVHQ